LVSILPLEHNFQYKFLTKDSFKERLLQMRKIIIILMTPLERLYKPNAQNPNNDNNSSNNNNSNNTGGRNNNSNQSAGDSAGGSAEDSNSSSQSSRPNSSSAQQGSKSQRQMANLLSWAKSKTFSEQMALLKQLRGH